MQKIVLLINVEEVKFDYKKVKNLVAGLFKNKKIDFQVEEYEDVTFEDEEEDIYLEIMTCDYSDEFENSYGIEFKIENTKTNKSVEIQIAEDGILSTEIFYKTLKDLLELTKHSIEKKIFS